jgi:hypothetical protein
MKSEAVLIDNPGIRVVGIGETFPDILKTCNRMPVLGLPARAGAGLCQLTSGSSFVRHVQVVYSSGLKLRNYLNFSTLFCPDSLFRCPLC